MKVRGKESINDLKQFLLSQYFYDGLKITLGVVLPSVLFYPYGLLETGITFSLGALYVSIVDNPGPVLHKRNAMLATNLFVFLTALLIGFTNRETYLLAIEIPLLCFFFSMFNVYGARASSVGIAALLTMIVGIDQHLDSYHTFLHALYLLAGGTWYMLFSLLLNRALPYRPAEQTLGECMEKMAAYIRIKADFYAPDTDLEKVQEETIKAQTIVYEKLDNVREILFKTRELLKDSSTQGNKLFMTFIDVVDLYEQTMESHESYEKIRKDYGHTGILEHYHYIILSLARELDHIAVCLHNHESPEDAPQTHILLESAKDQLEQLDREGMHTITLKRIYVNMKNVSQRLEQIYKYHQKNSAVPLASKQNIDRFVTHKTFDLKQIKENMSFRSAIFRHSVRTALVCLLAFLFARFYYTGNYSYWILLTIVVILKPGFSQTRQRNIERIIGTFAGGLLGILILHFVKDQSARFWFLIGFMLLTYSFMRIRYVVSVFFMTPFILIMFSFIGHNNDMLVVKERIIDTFIGAGIASLASYFILPAWESSQIKQMMGDVLLRNMVYLKTVAQIGDHSGKENDYKVARKEIYVSSSNLSAAFQRMLNEPKKKRQHVNEINKFILLNNLFASHTAALAQKIKEEKEWKESEIKELRKIFHLLSESYELLMQNKWTEQEPVLVVSTTDGAADPLLTRFVLVAGDLKKLCAQVS